jgi:chemotaxis protein MotB
VSNQRPIIIKKVKKVVGGGHHGGAWKVAYADFVTAMMAFFLLMWLLNMSSAEKRVRLSYHFKTFSLFKQGGTSFMGKSSSMFSETGETTQQAFRETPTDKKKSTNENETLSMSEKIELSNWQNRGGDSDEEKRKEAEISINLSTGKKQYADAALNVSNESGDGYMGGIETALKQSIMDQLGDMKDQVLVDTVEDGVRIQMIDKDGSEMFEIGSSRLTPKAKEVLQVINGNINKLPNKIIVEGHTDSIPYSGKEYSNWELSTERASSSRRQLEANGLAPDRIIRVAGYADTEPLIKENPADPRNRRISITLKTLSGSNNDSKDKMEAVKKEMELPALKVPYREKDTKNKFIPFEIKKQDTSAKENRPSSARESTAEKTKKDNALNPVIDNEIKDPIADPLMNVSRNSSTASGKTWLPKPLPAPDSTTYVERPAAKNQLNPILKKIKEKEAMKSEKQAQGKTEANASGKAAAVKQSGKTSSSPLKKLSPLIVRENGQDNKQKADSNNWGPVVKGNGWDPVIKNDSWNPVLNKD